MQPNYSRPICKREHGEFTINYMSPVEIGVKHNLHGAVLDLVGLL